MQHQPFRILIADDDEEDVQLTKECLADNRHPVAVNEVEDGQYLIDLLKNKLPVNGGNQLPQLILLDINMPRKDGLQALKEIKEDLQLCKIPVVMFTTSVAPKDIERAYALGANCYVTKPQSVQEWCKVVADLGRFWIECVKLAV
jgi:two-component system, chemotaxis family, response regulator Rcp1